MGNWNSQKMGKGAGTEPGNGSLQNRCYSSDFSPVQFTELYKPSHWYAIIVMFFFDFFLLHNPSSNT